MWHDIFRDFTCCLSVSSCNFTDGRTVCNAAEVRLGWGKTVKKTLVRLALAAVILVGLVERVEAAPLSLLPADVIGSSTPLSAQFNASQVLDAQTGSISEPTQSGYWLGDASLNPAYFVVDLGARFQINQIELFNTHNAFFNDRGTGNFTVSAGNAVVDLGGGNFDLSGATSLLVSNTLSAVNNLNDPILSQTFGVADTASYRYIRFDALSVAATTPINSRAFGLNEIRFDATPVPEGSHVLLAAVAGMAIFGFARSRRWLATV